MQRDLAGLQQWQIPVEFEKATLVHADCFDWIEEQSNDSFHAVVTDPPYGLHEYSPEQQVKLRMRKGGVWRIPPSFDGHARSPLPRFTTLTLKQLDDVKNSFSFGRGYFYRSWFQAPMLWSRRIRFCHI